jgi:hypothetical protein
MVGSNALEMLVVPLCLGVAVPYAAMAAVVLTARFVGRLAARVATAVRVAARPRPAAPPGVVN